MSIKIKLTIMNNSTLLITIIRRSIPNTTKQLNNLVTIKRLLLKLLTRIILRITKNEI